MKFYGEPNTLVKTRKRKQFSTEVVMNPLFRFDENGEYETTDERLIQKLKKKFKYDENKFTCKKCGETFDNKGLLLAHYRNHKEG
jgi:uncharacterized Zn-finger protein